MVLSAYQQIRAQNAPVLANEDEDNFDRAFDFFRPSECPLSPRPMKYHTQVPQHLVIQGNSDVGKNLMAGENLHKTINFLAEHAFEPSLPEERGALIAKYGDPLEKAPVAMPGDTRQDLESKAVLKGMAVRKLMRTEDIVHIDNFISDNLNGYRLRLERGKLGLEKAE